MERVRCFLRSSDQVRVSDSGYLLVVIWLHNGIHLPNSFQISACQLNVFLLHDIYDIGVNETVDETC